MSESPVPLSGRAWDIAPFYVMELLARARALEAAGRSIIHMEIGEPDFPSPAPVIAAGQAALTAGRTHYTPALGLPALREAISDHYRQRYGVDVPSGRIIITPGASGALQLALAVLMDPGREVLIADPGYPSNRHLLRLFDGKAVGLPVGPETQYQLSAAHIAKAWTSATVAALLASPSNPTGTLVPQAEMERIVADVAARGGRVIVDEIYQGQIYDDAPQHTALSLSEQLFVVNSFSKYFGMTGWRLGWLVAPADYVPAIDRLAQNMFLAPSTPAQYAALAAFEPETLAILEARRREFERRRDYLLPALQELGFTLPVVPQGAFYLYAGCEKFSTDSHAFALALLDQTGVCMTPGLDFGLYQPGRHLRFAYTTSLENLREGVERLRRYLGP